MPAGERQEAKQIAKIDVRHADFSVLAPSERENIVCFLMERRQGPSAGSGDRTKPD